MSDVALQSRTKSPTPSRTTDAGASGSTIQLKGKSFGQQQKALAPDAHDLIPLQMQGGGGGNTGGVHAAASRGTSGSGGALPHLDKIQAAFGSHDVSNVQAYTGPAASEAAGAMGADAYATGNKVAFGKSASLHTAAHEAAHVVQQRAGVSLSGGVGQVGDRYEQHADAVADTVVQGRSAEGLLDKMSGGASSVQKKQGGGSVQRDAADRAKWNKNYTDLQASLLWLFNRQAAYARSWQSVAKKVDPPPAWQTALKVVGTVVLAAALGGLGGAIAGTVISATAKFATQFLINAAIEAGKKAVEEGVGLATAGKGGDVNIVEAFCDQQAESMAKSGDEASRTVSVQAGNAVDQKLSAAELKDMEKANRAKGNDKAAIHREMLVGLMNFQSVGGTDGKKLAGSDVNVEDTSLKGVLGLVISGRNDNPTGIIRAEADGINSGLKASLNGKLGDWLNGGKRKKGLQITVKPEWKKYTVSQATKDRATKAGQYVRGTDTANKGAIYFAFGRTADGSYTYTDLDADYTLDANWGADAGRWFLKNVKSTHEIVAQLRSFTLPKVT